MSYYWCDTGVSTYCLVIYPACGTAFQNSCQLLLFEKGPGVDISQPQEEILNHHAMSQNYLDANIKANFDCVYH